ncbi:MAG TPA: hypothetical protein VLC48_11475 [Gemmatimonadota bacterium]|nr:hypothetical protein [Gemmatimonadota bacterium]
MDLILIAKIAGAILVFGLGIWIGLGMPGTKGPKKPRDWHASDRLRATWINRMFFRAGSPSRGWDTGRLIVPKEGGEEGEEEKRPIVRLGRR